MDIRRISTGGIYDFPAQTLLKNLGAMDLSHFTMAACCPPLRTNLNMPLLAYSISVHLSNLVDCNHRRIHNFKNFKNVSHTLGPTMIILHTHISKLLEAYTTFETGSVFSNRDDVTS